MPKFFRRGVSKIYFVPTVADVTGVISPTRSEITAGVDLSPAVTAMAGFHLSNSPIPTPNLAERYTTQIPGEDTTPDSTLTLLDDDTTTTIRTALAKGTSGFLLFMPYGDVATKRVEVWAVTVTGYNDEWGVDNAPARSVVGFAVTRVPEQNGVIPT